MPELYNSINGSMSFYGLKEIVILDIIAGIEVVFNLLYFCLARKVTSGKSEEYIYMILLLLGIIGSIINFFTTAGNVKILSFDFIVDLCWLYFLIQTHKEN